MSRRLALDQLNIASPCSKPWDQMQRAGDERRFCDHCSKHVHDLSLMTLEDAQRLICESAGRGVCVRLSRDVDGRLITLDYAPPPPRQSRWKSWAPIAAAMAIAATIGGFMFGGRATANPPLRVLGTIAVPQQPMVGRMAPTRVEMGDVVVPSTQPVTRPSDAPAVMGEIYIPPATQPDASGAGN